MRVFCHEALHLRSKMQTASYNALVEKWLSDSESDERGVERRGRLQAVIHTVIRVAVCVCVCVCVKEMVISRVISGRRSYVSRRIPVAG